MVKKFVLALVISLFFLSISPVYAAEIRPGGVCTSSDICCSNNEGSCVSNGSHACQDSGTKDIHGNAINQCLDSSVGGTFGKINVPDPIKSLNAKDPSGAGGINLFLSNLVTLFYSLAFVVLIFMLLWGAWDWIISEGEKEKIHGAQQKIISAIIGIILFAITFALIRVLGGFTGFKFFVGQ